MALKLLLETSEMLMQDGKMKREFRLAWGDPFIASLFIGVDTIVGANLTPSENLFETWEKLLVSFLTVTDGDNAQAPSGTFVEMLKLRILSIGVDTIVDAKLTPSENLFETFGKLLRSSCITVTVGDVPKISSGTSEMLLEDKMKREFRSTSGELFIGIFLFIGVDDIVGVKLTPTENLFEAGAYVFVSLATFLTVSAGSLMSIISVGIIWGDFRLIARLAPDETVSFKIPLVVWGTTNAGVDPSGFPKVTNFGACFSSFWKTDKVLKATFFKRIAAAKSIEHRMQISVGRLVLGSCRK